MAETPLLRWIASADGWLIFSGGHTPGSEIRASALARAIGDGAVAYISFADDLADSIMDDMEDLGAPTGYLVDVLSEDAATINALLQPVSLIVIESGDSVNDAYRGLAPGTIQAIRAAYESGATIFVEGLAVNLFGRWVVADSGQILDGLDWVQNTFIEPESRGANDSRAVQAVLQQNPDAVAVNVASGSALALGPGNAVEIWGEDREVTLSLGSDYNTGA
jgi:hypothetical protein